MSDTHRLKSWPEYFEPIEKNNKTFDLRRDDRDFKVNDEVQFELFYSHTNEYGGRVCKRRINFILRNFEGLIPGYCILGLSHDEESA